MGLGYGGDKSGLRLGFWGWVTAWLEAVGTGLNWFGVSEVWIGLGLIGFLGFSWCFGGDLLRWVAVAVLGGAGFVFRWCCGAVVAALGGAVVLFAMIIPNSFERTRQHRSLWALQSPKIYHCATELCISETKNNNLVFLVFITLTQNF